MHLYKEKCVQTVLLKTTHTYSQLIKCSNTSISTHPVFNLFFTNLEKLIALNIVTHQIGEFVFFIILRRYSFLLHMVCIAKFIREKCCYT